MNRFFSLIGLELLPANHVDKALSGLGGLVAIGLVFLVTRSFAGPEAVMPIVASMGASAVLLFAVPHGQLSQPWPLVMGHLISAVMGVTSARLIAPPVAAAAVAVGAAITAMYYLRCLHPPGGATALTAVIGGEALRRTGYLYVALPIGINVAVMLAVAVLFNYPFRWRRYPAGLVRPPAPAGRLRREDWTHALQSIGTLADVSEDELIELHTLAVRHAAGATRDGRGARGDAETGK